MAALAALVRQALLSVPVGNVMGYVAQVAAHDRYQASRGIEAAAAFVAQSARAIGLADVALDSYLADGRPAAWWTFQAPTSWTPLEARMTVTSARGDTLLIDHASEACALATHSAATAPGGLRSALAGPALPAGLPPRACRDRVVLLDAHALAAPGTLAQLAAAGAAGVIAVGPSTLPPSERQHAARIELPGATSLFGWSVTPARFAQLRDWAAGGAMVHTNIAIDRGASMPVVSGVIPGDVPGEIWLTAHLCHPRPGANDNASGVAALLGIAEALLAWQPGRARRCKTVRFLWCPEFTGTAAALHARMARAGVDAHPHAVLNLDMVGEDQRRCGSPFVLEGPPAHRPCPLNAVAEAVLDAVFAQTAEHPGRWHPAPFLGYSDHALFAGPLLGCPALGLTHWPDRYNHSGADTVDKVCPVEMRRSMAAGAVLAQVLRDDTVLSRPLSGVVRAGSPEPGRPLACWPGPLNLRAMMGALPAAMRAELHAMVAADKGTLAVLANLAVRADGQAPAAAILASTRLALRRPPDPATCRWLFDALLRSGWIQTSKEHHAH